ncbi:hypothetical protein TREES_T100009663 [Tupaia chinensis]|uniref:Uncharacterized protein n=1 Tax=Tupaia chinensis TaxID=246437 RepID=L9LCS9_TUPCH|nr:hypothetical protein TREES_T100009663 [Tupaia chinensis]
MAASPFRAFAFRVRTGQAREEPEQSPVFPGIHPGKLGAGARRLDALLASALRTALLRPRRSLVRHLAEFKSRDRPLPACAVSWRSAGQKGRPSPTRGFRSSDAALTGGSAGARLGWMRRVRRLRRRSLCLGTGSCDLCRRLSVNPLPG